MDVLAPGAAHKYLGRKYTGDLSKRGHIGFQHRVQLAWAKFNHFGHVLANKHIFLKLRLRLFDSIISPTVLFGLLTMPLTQSELTRLDVVQTQMLRSMVGWVRTPDEDWRDTMARMRDKENNALGCYHVDNWTKQLAIRQHNFCCEICKATWVASNNFGVMSAEQLAKQLSQVTETKTWQTSQEMAGQIG